VTGRIYLDWNATAPLRPEARAAMLAAMDVAGNPSSVHAEGRAARAIMERARAQVAALVGCAPHQVVFTSGATEANATALRGAEGLIVGATEHESVRAAARTLALTWDEARCDDAGRPLFDDAPVSGRPVALSPANGETGALTDLADPALAGARLHLDATQAVGRVPFDFAASGAATAALSAHKLGGPRGVGALIHDGSRGPAPLIPGGGQEEGWRGGTANVIGVAGFGAAAEAALRDLRDGAWDAVAALRDRLEATISDSENQVIIPAGGIARLPNTSCIAAPGWRAETQVMQFDLAGFAVSAGSACSSGKVRESHVLRAMGFDAEAAASAIRVSLGPTTTEDEIDRFCDAWIRLYRKRRAKAA
jgi:cysteine desulfurase